MRKKTRGEVTLTPCRMGSGPREGETASSRGFEERLYEAMGPREMDHDDGKRSSRSERVFAVIMRANNISWRQNVLKVTFRRRALPDPVLPGL